jgi:hypothetical protein
MNQKEAGEGPEEGQEDSGNMAGDLKTIIPQEVPPER